MQKSIWAIIFVLIVIGFIPFKFPYNPKKLAENELRATHEESTCTTALTVASGTLIIPQNLQSFFGSNPSQISIDSTGLSMFEPIDDNQTNWFLVTDFDFIITGRTTGVDSSEFKYCNENYPVFKIDNWSPTEYAPNFWSFGRNLFLIYFLVIFLLMLTSVIILLLRKMRKLRS